MTTPEHRAKAARNAVATTAIEDRAKAMGRLADETRDKLGSAFRLANSAHEDQASDLLTLVNDTREWAKILGPDAEAWAEEVTGLASVAMHLMDSARQSLMLAHVQLGILTNEINNHA